MTYEAVEAALATQLRAVANLDDDQVSLGDYRILGYGHTRCAILDYEAFEARRDSANQKTLFVWRIRVHLYARYTDDDTANNELRDRRDDIILRLLQNPTLAGAAFDSLPTRGNFEAEEIVIGSISFLHEFLEVEIQEFVSA